MLERVEVGTGQDIEENEASKGYLLSNKGRCWDWSNYSKQISQQ